MQLEVGKQYRIVKGGASLSGWESMGNYSWQGTGSGELPVGSVLEYVGAPMGIGSDNVHEDTFFVTGVGGSPNKKAINFKGAFSPNFWGGADVSYLEEI